MNPLPAPPAEPLHILQPTQLLALAGLAFFLLAGLALLLLWQLLQLLSKRPQAPSAQPAKVPPVPQPALGIAGRIRQLEEKILASKAFREGCHRLAMLVKSHLGRETGLDVEQMTSLEIEQQLASDKAGASVAGPRVGGFMTKLSRRRYGREEPRRRDFIAACEEARALLVTREGRG